MSDADVLRIKSLIDGADATVHSAQPGDIYIDANDKLWRITAVCYEPTIWAEEVEGTLNDPNAPRMPDGGTASVAMAMAQSFPVRASITKRTLSGGAKAVMWSGWRRIWRRS